MSRGQCRQEMISSKRVSSPSYSFGHGKRDIRKQQYMGACFDVNALSPFSPPPDKYSIDAAVGPQKLTGRASQAEYRFGTGDRSGRMYPDKAGMFPGPGAYSEHSAIGTQYLAKRPS